MAKQADPHRRQAEEDFRREQAEVRRELKEREDARRLEQMERQRLKDEQWRWYKAPENPAFPIRKDEHPFHRLVKGAVNRGWEGYQVAKRADEFRREEQRWFRKLVVEMLRRSG